MSWKFIIIIILLTGTILCNKKTFRCFCDKGFVKVIAGIMGVLFTVVGVCVGIFSDNIASVEDGKGAYDNLYWFKPKNIIQFSVDELKCALQERQLHSNDPLVVDTIDLQGIKDSVHYIFVVDKTLSAEQTTQDTVAIEEFRKILYKRIGADSTIMKERINYFQHREDLMLASCIHKIWYENAGNSYQVLVYNGEKRTEKKDKYDNEFEIIQYKSFPDFLREYSFQPSRPDKSSRNSVRTDRADRKTNFARIVNTITNNLPTDSVRQRMKKVITIFSDFQHETETTNGNYYTVDSAIHHLATKPDIILYKNKMGDTIFHRVKTVLNLVELKFSNNKRNSFKVGGSTWSNNTKDTLLCKCKDSVCVHVNLFHNFNNTNVTNLSVLTNPIYNKTISDSVIYFFDHYFHFCHQYLCKELDLFIEDAKYQFMANMVTFPHQEEKTDSNKNEIYFRYPFATGKFNEMPISYIKFRQGGDMYMGIHDNAISPCDFVMLLTPADPKSNAQSIILKPNETKKIEIDTSIVYKAQIGVSKISSEMAWTFAFQAPDNSYKMIRETVPIKFVKKIPKTLCYMLIFSISGFSILVVTLLLYFCFNLFYCLYASRFCILITGIYAVKQWISFAIIEFIVAFLTFKVGKLILFNWNEINRIDSDFINLYLLLIAIIVIVLICMIIFEFLYKKGLHKKREWNKLRCPYQANNGQTIDITTNSIEARYIQTNNIQASNVTGNIKAKNASADEIKGNVHAKNVKADKVDATDVKTDIIKTKDTNAENVTSNIQAKNVNAGKIDATDVKTDIIKTKVTNAENITGNVQAKNVKTGKIDAKDTQTTAE